MKFSANDLSVCHASNSCNGPVVPSCGPTSVFFEMPVLEDITNKYNATLGVENSKLDHLFLESFKVLLKVNSFGVSYILWNILPKF